MNSSPSRQASIGKAAGRVAVPKTCWVSRSSSRKGSVRINIFITPLLVVLFSGADRVIIWHGLHRFFIASVSP